MAFLSDAGSDIWYPCAHGPTTAADDLCSLMPRQSDSTIFKAPQSHRYVTLDYLRYYLFDCTLQSVHVRLKQGKMGKKEVLEIPLGFFFLTQGEDDAYGDFLSPD